MFLQPLGGNTRVYRLFRDPKMVLLICLVLGLFLGIMLDHLSLRRRVVLVTGGLYSVLDTRARTVSDLLSEQKISLGRYDRLNRSLDTVLHDMMQVELYRYHEALEEVPEVLASPHIQFESTLLPRGKRQKLSPGQEGTAHKVYRVSRRDGRECRRELLYRRIRKTPRPKVELRGIGADNHFDTEGRLKLTVQRQFLASGGPLLYVPPSTLPAGLLLQADDESFLPVRVHDADHFALASRHVGENTTGENTRETMQFTVLP